MKDELFCFSPLMFIRILVTRPKGFPELLEGHINLRHGRTGLLLMKNTIYR